MILQYKDYLFINVDVAQKWEVLVFIIFPFGWDHCTQTKAMRKDFISGFSGFAKDKMNFFSYSNLTRNKFVTFVFAKISRNKCGRKCQTRIYKNDFKNI